MITIKFCGRYLSIFYIYSRQEKVNSVLNVKAVVAAFNQEKALLRDYEPSDGTFWTCSSNTTLDKHASLTLLCRWVMMIRVDFVTLIKYHDTGRIHGPHVSNTLDNGCSNIYIWLAMRISCYEMLLMWCTIHCDCWVAARRKIAVSRLQAEKVAMFNVRSFGRDKNWELRTTWAGLSWLLW